MEAHGPHRGWELDLPVESQPAGYRTRPREQQSVRSVASHPAARMLPWKGPSVSRSATPGTDGAETSRESLSRLEDEEREKSTCRFRPVPRGASPRVVELTAVLPTVSVVRGRRRRRFLSLRRDGF